MTDELYRQGEVRGGAPTGGWKGMAGKVLKFIIPLVVSVGLCVVMFRDIDFGEMVEVIKRDCDFRWIGLMLVMSLVPMGLRALRWGIQLRAIGVDAPVHVLLYSMVGTYAVNLVFPRLGEVWRTGYVAYRQDASFPKVFGSMIGDRFTDLVIVALLALGTFVVARGPIVDFIRTYPQAYEAILRVVESPWTWYVLAGAVALLWWMLARSKSAPAMKIKQFLGGLWSGFAALGRMKGKMQWLGLTVCIWGCYFLQLAVAFQAFDMTAKMLAENGVALALVCFVLTSISMGIPSNGGIGPYQTTMLFGLSVFMPQGVSHSEFVTTGAAFGNVIIASQTLMLIVAGVIVFALISLDRHGRRRRAH